MRIQFNKMEVYKNISGYQKYQVSNHGNVKNCKTNRAIKQSILQQSGYYYANIIGDDGNAKTVEVHRLVAQAFLTSDTEREFVDHIDNNKPNNHVDNLRYATRAETMSNRTKSKNGFCDYKGLHKKETDLGVPYAKMVKHSFSDRSKHKRKLDAHMTKSKELFGEFAKLSFP